MCGICGFVQLDGRPLDQGDTRLATAMNDTMFHRGPDGGAVFQDGPAALGHRRLAIIDLSTGNQPMTTADGRHTVVFNGEIYNYLELRAELEARGHVFRTHSDTESILHAYRQWGEGCVEKLHGMFAFGLWDAAQGRLFLARDRLGKKPLYYVHGARRFAFASELKALLADPATPRDLDAAALDAYLALGYVPAPLSAYAAVRKLPPAHCAVLDHRGQRLTRYWRLSMAPAARPPSFEDAAGQLAALLDDCVRCRLMSDVPLGAFLSGGIDSSAVVAAMAGMLAEPVRTAAIGFTEKTFDELEYARLVAEKYATDHAEFVVQPDAAAVLDKLVWHFDEPFADASAVPTYYVSQMARRRVTVALSGDGGDETFAGYVRRYAMVRWEDGLRRAVPGPLRRGLLGPLARLWPRADTWPRPLRLKGFLGNLAQDLPQAYCRDMAFGFRPDDRLRLTTPEFRRAVAASGPGWPCSWLAGFFGESGSDDPVSQAQYVDTMSYLPEDILVKVDRMSMANSLEVRAPLLDHRILEFAAALPSAYKLRGNESKAVLKAAVARRLPPRILQRGKQGFRLPVAGWLRAELKDKAHAAIFDTASGLADFLDLSVAREFWNDHQQGRQDNGQQLWTLMMLGLWRQGVPA